MAASSFFFVCAPVVTGRSSEVAGCAAPFTTRRACGGSGTLHQPSFFCTLLVRLSAHSTRHAVITPACTVYCSAFQSSSARTTTSRPPVLTSSARHCGASHCSLPQRLAEKLPASPSAGGHDRHTPQRRPFRPGHRVACAPCGGGGTHATSLARPGNPPALSGCQPRPAPRLLPHAPRVVARAGVAVARRSLLTRMSAAGAGALGGSGCTT